MQPPAHPGWRQAQTRSPCTASKPFGAGTQSALKPPRPNAAFQLAAVARPARSKRPQSICCAAEPVRKHASALSTVSALARRRGYTLKDNSFGPFLNLSLIEASQRSKAATLSGFLLPNRLHIESYRSLQSQVQRSLLHVSPGMILFVAALAVAKQNRVQWVYGLAIEDAPQQHRRLLRYLKRFGGQYVMTVREDLASVPARIFYGGFGTIIRGPVDQMFQRGLAMMQRTIRTETLSEHHS